MPVVDEVVVVDNNSKDGTGKLAEQAGAKVVTETRQGYGWACRTALASATGDLVLLVEPDGTFRETDIYKFLVYSDDFDVVFGTKTSKSCIWEGSHMGYFLRYDNCAVAKLLEYMHNGPCLTDVECIYKFFHWRVIEDLLKDATVGGSHFLPELMTLAIRKGLRCVEIPCTIKRGSECRKLRVSSGRRSGWGGT